MVHTPATRLARDPFADNGPTSTHRMRLRALRSTSGSLFACSARRRVVGVAIGGRSSGIRAFGLSVRRRRGVEAIPVDTGATCTRGPARVRLEGPLRIEGPGMPPSVNRLDVDEDSGPERLHLSVRKHLSTVKDQMPLTDPQGGPLHHEFDGTAGGAGQSHSASLAEYEWPPPPPPPPLRVRVCPVGAVTGSTPPASRD